MGLGMAGLQTNTSFHELVEDIEFRAGMPICLEAISFTKKAGVKLRDVILVAQERDEC
jgi:hypothetical protein